MAFHEFEVQEGFDNAALLVSAGKGWYWSAIAGHLPEEVFERTPWRTMHETPFFLYANFGDVRPEQPRRHSLLAFRQRDPGPLLGDGLPHRLRCQAHFLSQRDQLLLRHLVRHVAGVRLQLGGPLEDALERSAIERALSGEVGVRAGHREAQMPPSTMPMPPLLTAIPFTPGGLGVVELALITGLAAAGGPRAEVAAAVLIFRALTYVLPIPIGLGSYVFWRHNRSWRREPNTAPRTAL